MNLQDWKAKWYPISAQACSAEGAIDHSILKWTGLLPENREGLKLWLWGGALQDPDGAVFEVNATTCALCAIHFDSYASEPCADCPLSKSRGGVPCDRGSPTEVRSPWRAWAGLGEPQPMLDALHKAKVWMLEQVK